MKCYNETDSYEMNSRLYKILNYMRDKRGFDVKDYVEKKAEKLNLYMNKSGLDACVVAISGGIDSAVVLGIVKKASEMEDSPIKKICPVLLPCYNNEGVTNQGSATSRGKDVCFNFGLPAYEINMHDIAETIMKSVAGVMTYEPDNWAKGQLVPYARTPVLYYITSLLSVEGLHAIIVGTTNFSEGGYLGYVGKASDGMVDVQLISDIYKSEVYKVAEYLNLPLSVRNVTPAGDMYDGRVDEEVFGASYDFVELYQEYLCLSDSDKKELLHFLDYESKYQFLKFAQNLEHLHEYNSHKYLCGSPAVHLDLWYSNVKDGWNNRRWMDE